MKAEKTSSETPFSEPHPIGQEPVDTPILLDAHAMVADFHRKFGFPIGRQLHREGLGKKAVLETSPGQGTKVNVASTLMSTAGILQKAAAGLLTIGVPFSKMGDERPYRAHLMVEELAEVLQAMAERDEIDLADGLTDLVYTVIGTGVTYDLPHTELFCDVHRANMSKTRDEDDQRMKRKDPERGYEEPKTEEAIDEGRERARKNAS